MHVTVVESVVKDVTCRRPDGTLITLSGAYVLDATELGDVLPLAGVDYVTGFESRSETGEPSAPESAQPDNIQAFSWVFAISHEEGVDHTIDKAAGTRFPPPAAPNGSWWSWASSWFLIAALFGVSAAILLREKNDKVMRVLAVAGAIAGLAAGVATAAKNAGDAYGAWCVTLDCHAASPETRTVVTFAPLVLQRHRGPGLSVPSVPIFFEHNAIKDTVDGKGAVGLEIAPATHLAMAALIEGLMTLQRKITGEHSLLAQKKELIDSFSKG